MTDREIEILRLAANGYTPAEIASGLGLSVFTTKNHLTSAYRRLGLYGAGSVILASIRLLDYEQREWRNGR